MFTIFYSQGSVICLPESLKNVDFNHFLLLCFIGAQFNYKSWTLYMWTPRSVNYNQKRLLIKGGMTQRPRYIQIQCGDLWTRFCQLKRSEFQVDQCNYNKKHDDPSIQSHSKVPHSYTLLWLPNQISLWNPFMSCCKSFHLLYTSYFKWTCGFLTDEIFSSR